MFTGVPRGGVYTQIAAWALTAALLAAGPLCAATGAREFVLGSYRIRVPAEYLLKFDLDKRFYEGADESEQGFLFVIPAERANQFFRDQERAGLRLEDEISVSVDYDPDHGGARALKRRIRNIRSASGDFSERSVEKYRGRPLWKVYPNLSERTGYSWDVVSADPDAAPGGAGEAFYVASCLQIGPDGSEASCDVKWQHDKLEDLWLKATITESLLENRDEIRRLVSAKLSEWTTESR